MELEVLPKFYGMATLAEALEKPHMLVRRA